MLQLFGYLSGIFIFLGTIPYIRDIFFGKTKPQRSTWFIYSVLGSISFFSQLAKGATFSLWLTGVDTLSVVFIFFLSLWYGVGGFSKKDYIALCIAAIALVAWYFTQEAAIALYLVIGIDAIGTYLTIDKAYKDPTSETFSAWFFCAIAGVFAMLSVGSFNIILLSYPLYIFVANGIVSMAIKFGKKKSK
jgi:hypothetical protein